MQKLSIEGCTIFEIISLTIAIIIKSRKLVCIESIQLSKQEIQSFCKHTPFEIPQNPNNRKKNAHYSFEIFEYTYIYI